MSVINIIEYMVIMIDILIPKFGCMSYTRCIWVGDILLKMLPPEVTELSGLSFYRPSLASHRTNLPVYDHSVNSVL